MRWLLVLVCLVAGCGKYYEPGPSTVKEIDRIFMHEPGHFSFLIGSKMQTYRVISDNVRFEYDVYPRNKCWAEMVHRGGYGLDFYNTMTIHLHDPQEIDGGGWNHGKFGRGTTIPIE